MRIAIVSDIHEDVVGLRKALRKIDRIGYDRLVCLGDISGFSLPHFRYERTRDASGCLSLLREREAVIIPGNHDYYAARRIPPCSKYFCLPKNWYSLSYEVKLALTKGKLWLHETDLDTGYSAEEIDFLRSLPEYVVMDIGDSKVMLSHYVFPNHSGTEKGFYSWAKDFRKHFDFMEEEGCSVAFTGHAHERGYYVVRPDRYRHYRYKSQVLRGMPLIVGVPSITRNGGSRGFCIFEGGYLRACRF